jgi:outer membrane protein OmpA-like peptidoglycan-associated protein
MKLVAYIMIVLLIATLGGAAYFYQFVHEPLAGELERFKAGQPEFDKARRELKQYRDREIQDTAWITPIVETLKNGLAAEIASGRAEIAVAGNRIVVNIAESFLFTPMSVTFAKNSQQDLANLAALLKPLKDREIIVGNTTEPAPAQGKGRKKVPAKDARTLAAGRSEELVKFLEKNGVAAEALVAAAYPSKVPEQGFKIKTEKTMITIGSRVPASPVPAPAPKEETKPTSSTREIGTQPAPSSQPKPTPIPISPAPVKAP